MRLTRNSLYILGEVEFLAGTDHPERLAVRLGYKDTDCLYERLRRSGRSDLWERAWQGYEVRA